MAMKRCPVCGQFIDENARFCPECGADVRAGSAPQDQVQNEAGNQPGGQPYQQAQPGGPAYQQEPAPGKEPSVFGIIAIVCGVLSLAFSFIPALGCVFGAAALVLGILALKKKAKKGLYLTGIILGGVGLFVCICVLFFILLFTSIRSISSISGADSNPAMNDFGPGPASMPEGTDESTDESTADSNPAVNDFGPGPASMPESTDESVSESADASGTETNPNALTNITSLPTIGETVLFDQSGIKITATSLDAGEYYLGPAVNLKIDNTTDKAVTILTEYTAVNDYNVDNMLAGDLKAGESKETKLYIYGKSLNLTGIRNIGVIDIGFDAVNTDTLETIASGKGTIRTSDYASADKTVNDSGKEIYNDKDIRIVSQSAGTDENGTYLQFFMKNGTSGDLEVDTVSLKIDGTDISPYYYKTIAAGKMCISRLYISDDLTGETAGETTDENTGEITDESLSDSNSALNDFGPGPASMPGSTDESVSLPSSVSVDFEFLDPATYDVKADTGVIQFTP